MMIWKIPIKVTNHQSVKVPEGAKVIRVGLDPNDVPCLWVIFDGNRKIGDTWIDVFIYGTGQTIKNDEEYVGSFNQHHTYVWHVFIKETPNETTDSK